VAVRGPTQRRHPRCVVALARIPPPHPLRCPCHLPAHALAGGPDNRRPLPQRPPV